MNMKKLILRVGLPAVILIGIFAVVLVRSAGNDTEYTTFTVRQGPLDIKVLEGGNLEAMESQEVKSQVRGYPGPKIIFIEEEGTYITEEDVANKMVLVELDSSEIQEKLTTSQISFKGTEAGLTEALKGYEIQLNQSQSDIYAAELETKFAKLEMAKYLGEEVTEEVLGIIGDGAPRVDLPPPTELSELTEPEEGAQDGDPESNDEPNTVETQPGMDKIELEPVTIEDLRLGHPDIAFSSYVTHDRLGNGAANQELANLTSAAALAEEDLSKAETELAGQDRLWQKKFITDNDFNTAKIRVEKQEAARDAAVKALDIFKNYEFPKQAEKLTSDYVQARRKLARTEQQALSQIAQANAKLLSAQERYQIELKRIEEYEEQIEFCVMRAERPGLVVYGGNDRYWRDEPIKEGTQIRERQTIITIPDTTTMAVKVNIHESDIKKVEVGQKARIRVDAFPDRRLEGEVKKVAVLPDSENRWMNPDLKVYETTIAINSVHEWLKPGMSAEAEILIKRLDNAIYIPLQSVVPKKGKLICFVVENGNPVPREIETSDITVEYIVVTEGLDAGEQVLIRPPEGSRNDEDSEDREEEDSFNDADDTDASDTEVGDAEEAATDDSESADPSDENPAPESDDAEPTPALTEEKLTQTESEAEPTASESD